MGALFREVLEGFEFNPGETDQWTGKRRFMETKVSPNPFEEDVSLPTFGDTNFPTQPAPYDVQPTNFKVRSVTYTHYSNKDEEGRIMTADYSTKNINFQNVPDPDEAQENLQVGGEFMLLGGLSGNAGATKFAESGGTIDNKLRIFIPTGTYTFSESFATFAASITSFTGKIGQVLTGDAQWLMAGATVSEFINDSGTSRFQCVRTYSYKTILGPAFAGGAAGQGWNLVWDPKKAHWDVTLPLIYTDTTFPDTMPSL